MVKKGKEISMVSTCLTKFGAETNGGYEGGQMMIQMWISGSMSGYISFINPGSGYIYFSLNSFL
jgi:hypothetical protein